MTRIRTLAILAVALLAACSGSGRLTGSDAVSVVPLNQLPEPTRADVSARQRPYSIGPFDKLSIVVFGVPELGGDVQADASGRVSVPLVGTIEAAGKTPTELADVIAERLRKRFIRNPQVTVNLKDTVSQVITVDGEVREPGQYPVIGKMSLMRAVATAKGVTEYAKLEQVTVFRTVNNQHMAALYSLNAIRRGAYDDPEIFANDVVVVGNSPSRRLFKDILAASSLITTPIVVLLR